jgi:hypothetical protein
MKLEEKIRCIRKYGWYLTKHKFFVMIECVKEGMLWRGLIHDLSKLNPKEFFPYAYHFYQDNKPKRDSTGYYKPTDTGNLNFEMAWLHHIHKNKHHWQHYCISADNDVKCNCGGTIINWKMIKNGFVEDVALKDQPKISLLLQNLMGDIDFYAKNIGKNIAKNKTKSLNKDTLNIGKKDIEKIKRVIKKELEIVDKEKENYVLNIMEELRQNVLVAEKNILNFLQSTILMEEEISTKYNFKKMDQIYIDGLLKIIFQRVLEFFAIIATYQLDSTDTVPTGICNKCYELKYAFKVYEMEQDDIREMVCDWKGAGRAQKSKYSVNNWYNINKNKMCLGPHTKLFIEAILSLEK